MSAPLSIQVGGVAAPSQGIIAFPSTVGRFTLLREDAIELLVEPTWLVPGIIVRDSLGLLYGPPDIGKSFVALDLLLSVATGTPFLGRRVEAGPTLYVVAEGGQRLRRRFAAWKHRKAISSVPAFLCLPQAVNLLDRQQVELLVTSIKEQCAPLPVLVVIDTLHRCFHGGDENSSRDMGVFIEAMDYVRRQTGAAVVIVHHLGKTGTSERGSSALRGAMDTMIAMTETTVLTLHCERQKDDAPFADIGIALKPCLESLVVELETGREADDLGGKDRFCLDALRDAGPDGLTHGAWVAQCDQRGVASSSFDRARKRLVAKGRVKHDDQTGLYSVATAGPLA